MVWVDAVTRHTQPKRNFAHALDRIMDRVKPQGPDTSCSRKIHQVEVSQRERGRERESQKVGHGCDCQLGDLCVDLAQA